MGNGRMSAPAEILSAAQMRALEEAEIGAGRVSGLELMERAGAGVCEAAFDLWPDLAARPGRALVMAGPGNNGGDGLVIARRLMERGWEVAVFFGGEEARLSADAATALARWRLSGGAVAALDVLDAGAGQPPDIVVDALFGTGLARAPAAPFDRAIEVAAALRRRGSRVLAVDIPSGLSSDTGLALGATVAADLTVSFHAAKLGHYLAEGAGPCGRLRVADIGLTRHAGGAVMLVGPPPPARILKRAGHKYDYGHALVMAGGPGHGGAARMAARAALRVGAGLVTLGCPAAALPENAARLDAVMTRPVDDAPALERMLADRRLSAILLGPGLGVGEATRARVLAALASGRPVVLDADALTSFADDPEALFRALHRGTVLTPHEGEFACLFPDLGAGSGSRTDRARMAAERAGSIVLLKGPDTVIAAPDGGCRLHAALYDRAAPWLATAGAGDVLAGLIAGLLARGLEPAEAAAAAVWLHVEAARRVGPGLIAEDLSEALPAVLTSLEM